MSVEAAAVPGVPFNAVLIGKGHPYFKEIDATLKPSQAGPGMFISKKDPKTGEMRLFAMPVPVTRVERDPVNEERTVDIPLRDDQNRILYQLDPAARNTIALMNPTNPDADSVPTTPFPDSKDAVSASFEKLQVSMVEQQKASDARLEMFMKAAAEERKSADERFEKLVMALAGKKEK